MSRLLIFTAAALIVAAPRWTSAANMVTVESKTVNADDDGVTVGIYISNDIDLAGCVIPLELRSNTPGAFPVANLVFEAAGRFLDLSSVPLNGKRYLSEPSMAGDCSGPASHTFTLTDSLPYGFYVSPDAVLYSFASFFPDSVIASGSDGAPGSGTPSFELTFDVGCGGGTFEIDTCCTTPANHLLFVAPLLTQTVVPDFTKGVVTIEGCTCVCDCPGDPVCDGITNVFDVIKAVDVAFRGDTPAPDPNGGCNQPPTDTNCDRGTDVFDVVNFIDVAFRGGDPGSLFCVPCAP